MTANIKVFTCGKKRDKTQIERCRKWKNAEYNFKQGREEEEKDNK